MRIPLFSASYHTSWWQLHEGTIRHEHLQMKIRIILIALILALVSLLSWGFEEYECDEKLRLTNDGLVLAAVHGDAGAIACILDSETPDVDVDSEDQVGRTPLFWAAFNGHEDAVRMLILRYVEGLTPILFVAIIITSFNCNTILQRRKCE